ncbi:MAG: glycoside hydrolase family 3 C-terminal domain-containing protein, partial [Lentisphaeria bacterium]|nr:glycoside hydrolase family 3 C-terminal domain-containing protein [Lentisphaeria bacterium]
MLPFQNPGLAANERAEDLLGRLMLDEKLGMLNMNNEAVPRLGIPEYHWWNEALHGVARNGKAAMFPQAIALAATFTPEYAEKMGEVIREEAWIKYQHYSRHGRRDIYCGLNMYSPNINIFRDPRWGRGHETYGECPVLTALMGSAYVRGVQGDDPEHLHCSTTLKHFAAHSGPERFRSHFDSEVSARDLAQTYLFAFRFCLKHHPAKSIMTAYNALNGTPMSVNRTILGETVREQWGFSGVTVTDVGTAANLVNRFKICRDYPEALALEISSGVDVCCEMFEDVKQHFREAFRRGLLKAEDIDRAVRNQLTLKFQLGLFDPQGLPDYSRLECREHRELSRSIAERGMVLLKNDGLLPLRPGSFRKIAVIGPTADDREVLRGNYAGTATRYITILDGLLDAFGEDNVIYARGCEIQDTKTEIYARDGDRMTEALVAAEQADLVVMCLGLTPIFEGEIGGAGTAGSAGDKLQLEYSSPQKQLLGLIRSAGKPIVLLNCSGSAVVIPETEVNAVLQIFYPGPDGGR